MHGLIAIAAWQTSVNVRTVCMYNAIIYVAKPQNNMVVSQSFIQSALYRAGTHAATQLYLRMLQNFMLIATGTKIGKGSNFDCHKIIILMV